MRNRDAPSPALLSPGTRLGHYEIVDFVAAGGMGQVYRARDLSLGRYVALKVLPENVASDLERRTRFEREARLAAALNHPNIVTIHSVEQADGQTFITMELVRGRPLDTLIPASGFPRGRFFAIAVPIANAVSAAHEHGITHRDLKPANVLVSDDGMVKVLDFGLAKRHDAEAAGDSSPTVSVAGDTSGGRILGTIGYMSPEQAEGRRVDARSDVFSLGTMLYEMATGQRPFVGDTAVATLAAIVRDTPKPVTDVNPSVPRDLDRIIRRALAKDPDRRQQSGKDLRNELDDLRRELESGELQAAVARPSMAPSRQRLRIVLAAAVVAAIAAGVLWLRRGTSAVPPASVPAFTGLAVTPITSDDGQEIFPSLSPDGKWIVYTADEQRTGQTDILLRAVGGLTAINLTRDSPADDLQPVFSPDGERIAFRSERDGGGLFVMQRTGESVRRIIREGFNPSWSPDGFELVYAEESVAASPRARAGQGSRLWVVSIQSGDRRLLSESDGVQPSWSPHGQRIAYWAIHGDANQRDIWTVPAKGGEPSRVTEDAAVDWNPVWSSDGTHLYFSSDRSGTFGLWRVRMDEATGQASASPEPVAIQAAGLAHLSFSADGRSMAMSSLSTVSNIEILTYDAVRHAVTDRRPLTRRSGVSGDSGEFGAGAPNLSPDGKRLAFARDRDLWVQNVDGTGLRQLTKDAARDTRPAWSPDSTRLLFDSDRSGRSQIWSMNADGSGLRRVIDREGFILSPIWSPDGSRAAAYRQPIPELLLFDPARPIEKQHVEELPTYAEGFTTSSWSRDRSQIAGQVPRQRGGIVIYSLAKRTYTRATETGREPNWLADSRTLLYSTGSELRLLDTVTSLMTTVFGSKTEFLTGGVLSPDGREIFLVISKAQGDILLASLANGTF